MKAFHYALVFLASLLMLQACSDEGLVKVFKCPDDKPYLNTVNNRCYSSEEAAEEVNRHLLGNGDDEGEQPASGDNQDEGRQAGQPSDNPEPVG